MILLDGDGADFSQLKDGVAKVTSKISSVASNVIETFQVILLGVYVCEVGEGRREGERESLILFLLPFQDRYHGYKS